MLSPDGRITKLERRVRRINGYTETGLLPYFPRRLAFE
jgi:hypothetical protein